LRISKVTAVITAVLALTAASADPVLLGIPQLVVMLLLLQEIVESIKIVMDRIMKTRKTLMSIGK
jgi:hypothetical protein